MLSAPGGSFISTDIGSSELRSSVDLNKGNGETVSMEKVMGWEKVIDATQAGLTQDQIDQILENSVHKRREDGARLNAREFTKFARELNKAVLESHYPPEITVEVTDVRHNAFDLSVESSKLGTGQFCSGLPLTLF
jgi:hypothetical protein